MRQLEDLLQHCTVKLFIPGQIGWGTGFFVAPGLILTCAHVVRESSGSVQVWWQEITLEALVEQSLADPYDLALLRVTLTADVNPPCVLLAEEVRSRDPLYLFGYPDEGDRYGEPRTFNCDGTTTGNVVAAILFNLGQVRPGMSGSPLLNQRTGKICGVVKFTRDRGSDLGGGAIPTSTILEQFPELRSLQQAFHGEDRRWRDLLPSQQSEIDFQPYLCSIATTYEHWWQYYTLTDAEGKQREKQKASPLFDFGLMVQTVKKEEPKQRQEENQKQPENPEREKVERFAVLEGLRKYALGEKREHVLLVGRPGSGKSTALARLLLEETTTQTSQSLKALCIPVLVELRAWQGSIEKLIFDALNRQGLSIAPEQLGSLLAQAFLMWDGLNELPSEEARLQLFAFRRNHPHVPMIFTTRDLRLGGDLGIDRKLEMQPLTENQMQAFIQTYIPQQAEAMLRQFKGRLREFGQTPLLLWMLCSLFQQTQTIPRNLGEVFRLFTQGYEEGLKQDVVVETDRRRWPDLLKALAAQMMQGEKPTELQVAVAPTEIYQVFADYLDTSDPLAPRKALDDLLKHHLLQRNGELVEFRHQLIQEYYAAEWLLERLEKLDDATWQREYLNYLKWTEPIALMLALVSREAQVVRVVQQALLVDLHLGARLAGEVRSNFQSNTVTLIPKNPSAKLPSWLFVDLLAQSNSEVVIPVLLQAMEYLDSDVCRSASEALVKIGSEAAISALLLAMKSSNREVRWCATEALVKIGSEVAITALLQAMEYSDWDVTWRAAKALDNISSEESISVLLQAMEDLDWDMQKRITQLGKIGSEAAISALLQVNKKMHRNAAKALDNISSEVAIPGLLQAMEDSDRDVRRIAAEALGKFGSEVAIPGLLQAMEDSDRDVRRIAAEALGKFGSEVVISGLLQMMKYSNRDVCKIATEVLGKIGSKKAIPSLLQAMEDSDRDVRRIAAEALGKIGSEEAIPALLQAIKNSDWDVSRSATEALGKIGNIFKLSQTLILQELSNTLNSKDLSLRRHSAEAIIQIGNPRILTLLKQNLPSAQYAETLQAIQGIQAHCQFYNYEIWQKAAKS
jgi:HEAT repeat protein/DNA polymerase III delta prime subunit